MSQQPVCPDCGSEMPFEDTGGHCPQCLLDLGITDPDEAVSPVSEPERIGEYLLLEKIAHGGMGDVFKARHQHLQRTVALKRIRLERLPEPDIVLRFQIETAAVAGLDHAHIVPLYEAGEAEGIHFFTMKLMEGGSLADQISQEHEHDKTRLRRLVTILTKVCDAVHYAHERGVIHRDLKPTNILLDRNGEPGVSDFGLAKALETELELTRSTSVLGSPSYMAPEQALEQDGRLTTAADTYSLGAILYEILTGKPPFTASSALETLKKVVDDSPRHPSTVCKHVNRDLETICLKCLEKEPKRRYSSARALSDELQRWLMGKPILARPVSAFESFWRWCRRNPALSSLSSVAAVILVAGTIGVTWQWQRAEKHAQSEAAERARAETTLAQMQLQHAEDLLGQNKSIKALEHLAQIVRKYPKDRVARERLFSVLSYRSFALPTGPAMRHEDAIHDARFSRDGSSIITVSSDRSARVWNAQTGEPLTPPLMHDNDVLSACFNLAGNRIATVSADHSVRIWDVDTGIALTNALVQSAPILAMDFSPDGDRLIIGCKDGKVQIYDVLLAKPILEKPIEHRGEISAACFGSHGKVFLTAGRFDGYWRIHDAHTAELLREVRTKRIEAAELSPDGKQVAVASYSNFACVWDWQTGEPVAKFVLREAVNDVAFSPDGRLLATASRDRRTVLWDLQSKEVISQIKDHLTWVESVEFSEDGFQITTREKGNQLMVWDWLRKTSVVEPFLLPAEVTNIDVAPSGKQLVLADRRGRAQVWDLRPGVSRPLLLTNQRNVRDAKFNAEGTRVLTGNGAGEVIVWNAHTGNVEHEYKHRGNVHSVDWSPDESKILASGIDRTARVWDLDTGDHISVTHTGVIFSSKFSPDGNWFVTASFDGTARIWETQTGRPLSEPLRHRARLWSTDISPDGNLVVTGSDDWHGKTGDNTVRVWNVKTGKPAGEPMRHRAGIRNVEFSPDGSLIVSASMDNTAAIWDVATGRRIATLPHDGFVTAARFDEDSDKVVTASKDNTARIWDARTGRPVGEPLRHRAEVQNAVFSLDGIRVATTSWDGTARIWDAATGKPLSEPLKHFSKVRAVQFHPDGSCLLTGSLHARVWELPTASLSAQVPHMLTEALLGRSSSISQSDSISNDSWLDWFVDDRSKRKIYSNSPLAVADWSATLAQHESSWGAMERVRRAPDDGLAWADFVRHFNREEPHKGVHQAALENYASRKAVELSPREGAAWRIRAEVLLQAGKTEQLNRELEGARKLLGNRYWIADLLGGAWEKEEQWEKANDLYTRAMKLSKGRNPARYAEALTKRRNVLLELGRSNEISIEWSEYHGVPERAAIIPETCIDLSVFYNAALDETWHHAHQEGNDLSILPQGLQILGGVTFDLRGLVQLAGLKLNERVPGFPDSVGNIPIRSSASRLHFLHASLWGNAEKHGTPIGSYTIHHANGESSNILLRHGYELSDWRWHGREEQELPNGKKVWRAANPHGAKVRLFLTTWENPHPNIEISHLDFESAMTNAAPFLVAVSLEF